MRGRENNYVSTYMDMRFHGFLLAFKVLFSTCKQDWILHPSSFLLYLATMLQNKVFESLFPLFWLGIIKNYKYTFFWNLANQIWKTWYKLEKNHHNSSCTDNLHGCCCIGPLRKDPPNLGRSISLPLPASLHLKMFQAGHLEIFSTASLQNSKPRIMVCSNH